MQNSLRNEFLTPSADLMTTLLVAKEYVARTTIDVIAEGWAGFGGRA